MSGPGQPSRQWRNLCQLAFLETDPVMLRQRIQDARLAIAARHGAEDMHDVEASDMQHALEVLKRLEAKISAA